MSIDFTTPMTFYELVGIILAFLALLVPFVKWIIEKWFKRLRIDFLISDVITIYFNKSGSYINLGGVYKAENKTATIKNISVQIVRKSDNATLNLSWSTFPSPIVKEIAGQFEHTFETAHPFSANADMLTPAFIEFTDENSNISEDISADLLQLYNYERSILQQGLDFFNANGQAHSTADYSDAKVKLHERCFWKVGKYEVSLVTKYNNNEFVKRYHFELTAEDVNKLQNNIENLLVEPIASNFNFKLVYHSILKKITDL